MVVPYITIHKTYINSHADLLGAEWWRSAVPATVHVHRRHPFSAQTLVLDSLFVPAVRLSTVGRRNFPVAGARVWNDLLSDTSPRHRCSVFTFK